MGIQKLADLPTPWPLNSRAMGQRWIISLAIRCMRAAYQAGNTPAVGVAIAEELVAEVTRVLDEQMDSVVSLVANSALEGGARAPSERLASFTYLVEARLRVQRARTAARREGVNASVVAQLDSVIEGLRFRGFGSSRCGEHCARRDDCQGRRRRARARDRRLTLTATALLLPALLFGFLGINWIPTAGLQEWWVFFVVLAAGAGLGVVGWWLGNVVFGRPRGPQQRERDDPR